MDLRFPRIDGKAHSTVRATITPRPNSGKLLKMLGVMGGENSGEVLSVLQDGLGSGGDLDEVFRKAAGVDVVRPSKSAGGRVPEPHKGLNQVTARPRGRVTFGAPTIGAGLNRGHVDPVITRAAASFLRCYERRLRVIPSLSGQVVVRFTVNGEGRVSAATVVTTSVGDTEVHACLVSRFSRLRFPQPPNRGSVVVSQPLTFRPVN